MWAKMRGKYGLTILSSHFSLKANVLLPRYHSFQQKGNWESKVIDQDLDNIASIFSARILDVIVRWEM